MSSRWDAGGKLGEVLDETQTGQLLGDSTNEDPRMVGSYRRDFDRGKFDRVRADADVSHPRIV
jgi:hypothetical protein